jgi:hypothetical protein
MKDVLMTEQKKPRYALLKAGLHHHSFSNQVDRPKVQSFFLFKNAIFSQISLFFGA